MIKIYRNCLEMIIPDRDCDGNPVDPIPVRDCLSRALGSVGLGGSLSEQIGIWADDVGVVTREDNHVIRVSFPSDCWAEIVGVVMKFAALAATQLKQAELAVYVNGAFVTTSSKLDDGHEDVEASVHVPKPKNPLNRTANSRNSDSFSLDCIK